MMTRVLSISLAALLLAAPAFAQSLTDFLQESRMTVLEVKKEAGQIYALEAGRLRVVELDGAVPLVVTDKEQRADLNLLRSGDIIKVERKDRRIHKIVVLRHAWEEMASPEQ